MPMIAVFDWSQIGMPSALSPNNIKSDVGANNPDEPYYNPDNPSWVGQTYTFAGGAPTQIRIADDDGVFEDGYSETGAPATLIEAVTINGVTYPAGSVVENEFSLLDSSGNEVHVLRIGGENVGFVPSAPYYNIPAGVSFVASGSRNGMGEHSSDAQSSSEAYSGVICYAPGTRIATPGGHCRIEALRPGDRVNTADGGPMPVRWARRSTFPLDGPASDRRPVLIRAGALGAGRPQRDLVVSPQHRILIGGAGQLEHLWPREALAPAKSLTGLPGIRVMHGKQTATWVHIALDTHALVTAEGCLAESLLLGPWMLERLPGRDRRALAAIYGPPAAPGAALNGPPARPCLRVSEMRRHIAGFRGRERKAADARPSAAV